MLALTDGQVFVFAGIAGLLLAAVLEHLWRKWRNRRPPRSFDEQVQEFGRAVQEMQAQVGKELRPVFEKLARELSEAGEKWRRNR